MITGMQVRMALAALRWTHDDLAKRVGVTRQTIQRLADIDGIPNMKAANLAKLQSALEAAGCEFGPDSVTCRPRV